MKYIVLRAPAGEAPVLFPRDFLHRYVAELFAPMRVVAAGFVRIGDGGVEWALVALTVAAFVAVWRFRVGVLTVVALCALAGVLGQLAG